MNYFNAKNDTSTKLYSELTRRICVLIGSMVLALELVKWQFSDIGHSLEISIAIIGVSVSTILVGCLSGVLFSRRPSAWAGCILILFVPLLEGIEAGGVDPITLAFAVSFPVFFTLILGPKHTILGAASGIFLILFLTLFPLATLQTWLIGTTMPTGQNVLDLQSSLSGIVPVVLCAAATYTLARQNQDMQAKLNREAVFDNLTGIPNRRAFDQQVVDEIERAERVRTPLSMMVFDIDNFKMYNDLYGHQAGDRALRSVARAIDSVCVRSTDFVARYGGEEFVALLPATTDDRAELLAAKIRSNLKRMKDGSIDDHQITLSAGIAVLNGEARVSPEELFRRADEALYKSKRNGKDCVTIYENNTPKLQSIK